MLRTRRAVPTSILVMWILCGLVHAVKYDGVRKISDDLDLLAECGHESYVLHAPNNDRVVLVTPGLVGRVMSTGFDGVDGTTDSWINEAQLRKGATKSGPGGNWAAFGGEERIWYAPEGGRSAFYFEGTEQRIGTYIVPEPLNSAKFQVTALSPDARSIEFMAPIHLKNIRGHEFDLEVTRRIEALDSCPFALGFGDDVEVTGFESKTWTRNIGPKAITKKTGPISTWTLGMFPSYPNSVVMVPFHRGPDSELGPPINTEYFKVDMIPTDKVLADAPYENYYAVKDGVALVKANGNVMTKVEVGPRRSLGRMASVDLKTMDINIVEFRQYPEMEYGGSFWLPYDGDDYDGSAVSIFTLTKDLAQPFYELECISPSLFLEPGEQYCHVSRTYRLRGDKKAMKEILEKYFNADMDTLREFDEQAP
jgi:hypothetical protein